MVAPWPQWLVTSFQIANQPQFATDQSAYYGPYNRLLCYLFGIKGPFEINPQFLIPQPPHDVIDQVAWFTIEFDKHPVFFIGIKAPASFASDSERQEADNQMRGHFHDLWQNLVVPRLLGISVFGTRMAFYEYVAATDTLTPYVIAAEPEHLNDVAPTGRWNYDVLEADGISQMRRVVKDVKAMCRALNN